VIEAARAAAIGKTLIFKGSIEKGFISKMDNIKE
jgi:hypothetical protein